MLITFFINFIPHFDLQNITVLGIEIIIFLYKKLSTSRWLLIFYSIIKKYINVDNFLIYVDNMLIRC